MPPNRHYTSSRPRARPDPHRVLDKVEVPAMAPEMVPREETLEDAAEDLLAWADHLQWAAAPHTAPHHSQGLRSTGRHQQVPHHT